MKANSPTQIKHKKKQDEAFVMEPSLAQTQNYFEVKIDKLPSEA
jgi:hypothetical protein